MDELSAAPQPQPLPEPQQPLPAKPLVEFYETGGGLKCAFLARMDAVAVQGVEALLRERFDEAEGKHIVFDLEQVDFVGSSFLRLCIMASKASKGDFSVINACHGVRGVFHVAGLASLVKTV